MLHNSAILIILSV